MKHEYQETYGNVLLRPLIKSDIEYLRKWRNDSRNTKYLNKIDHITREMQLSWYDKYLTNNNEITFAIVETKEINRIVGSISLYNIEHEKAECGKIMVGESAAHGKNVGVNSLKALFSIAFKQLKLQEIYLYVYKANEIAVHVYEKAGMKVISEREGQDGTEYLMCIKYNEFSL